MPRSDPSQSWRPAKEANVQILGHDGASWPLSETRCGWFCLNFSIELHLIHMLRFALGLVGFVVNVMELELRTAEESQAMFHEGYEFLKTYKALTYMSLRRGGLVSDHILPGTIYEESKNECI